MYLDMLSINVVKRKRWISGVIRDKAKKYYEAESKEDDGQDFSSELGSFLSSFHDCNY